MKLQTKLTLVLLAGVLTVYLGSCLVQRYCTLKVLDRFSHESLAGEVVRQWQWVTCVQRATEASLVDAMTSGDMDKFEKMLAAQRQVPGLQELSLFNAKGRVAYSSVPERLKKEMPDDLKIQALASSAQDLKRQTDDSFEIYQPLHAAKNCIECHTDWKLKQVCGVMSMRFTTDALKAEQNAWSLFDKDFRKTNATTAGITIGALTVVLGVLIVLIIRYQVAVPLKRIAASLFDQAAQVTSAAGQVSSASQTLAEGANEQAASIEETSASLEQVSSMTNSNAANVEQANQLAKQTRVVADKGAGDMQDMNVAMATIKSSSDEIAKIIKTIDEIAFQTNILALNAAVEAARAGEAGLGFAVVADEVRNLAQRSAQAAKETATKIEDAISKTGQGVEISAKVTATLNDIVAKARQVDELAAEVANSSREQTQGIAQINRAVGQMDKVTQANAATSEESAAAAAQLNTQAEVMKQCVAGLLELVNGENRSPSRANSNGSQGPDSKPLLPHLKIKADKGSSGNGKTTATAPGELTF